MRFILDQGIPRDAAALLRERGHDCIHVGDIGMSMASDEEILVWSLEQGATGSAHTEDLGPMPISWHLRALPRCNW